MAADIRRRTHLELYIFHGDHLPRDPRATRLFHQRGHSSDEMTYRELGKYIADLRQSGFDTIKLQVQLANKLSVPAITLVMAIIAVSVCSFDGQTRRTHRHCHRHRCSYGYWVHRRHLQLNGGHRYTTAATRGMVPGSSLCLCRMLSAAPYSHIETVGKLPVVPLEQVS